MTKPGFPRDTVVLSLGFAAGIATAGTIAHAALSARSQLFGPVLIAGPDAGQIALTYDDGPNPNATPQLLDLLAAHNVLATFFMIGRFVPARTSLVRRVAAAGHRIGNHTMTHPWLAWQTERRIREELARCNTTLQDAIGSPVTLFRPPHGARRPAVLRIAAELGLTTVNWNVMPKDWLQVSPETLSARMHRAIRRNQRIGRASNILLHDGDHRAPGADRQATLKATELLLKRHPGAFVTPDAWIAV